MPDAPPKEVALEVAIMAAETYLAFLAEFRYDMAKPTEMAALGGHPKALKVFETIYGHESVIYLRLIEGLLHIPDPFAASVLAVQLGSLIEHGANPHPLGDAMVHRLAIDFTAARKFAEMLDAEGTKEPEDAPRAVLAAAGKRDPHGAAAWAGQQLSTAAAMTAWSRHPLSRRVAARTPELAANAAYLGAHGGYAYFISELLHSADGEHVLVLSPEQRKGFLVELFAVRNMCHLFALCEDALVGDPANGLLEGPKLDAEVAAVARSERMLEKEMTFPIAWHYEYWFGVHPDAAAAITGLHPAIGAMIGIEAQLRHLPLTRNQAIILMRPRKVGSRTCKVSDFFPPIHDALRSGVLIRHELSPEEVDTTIAELRADAEKAAGITPAVDK